jgi:hypothetical protein
LVTGIVNKNNKLSIDTDALFKTNGKDNLLVIPNTSFTCQGSGGSLGSIKSVQEAINLFKTAQRGYLGYYDPSS